MKEISEKLLKNIVKNRVVVHCQFRVNNVDKHQRLQVS